jgi:uncharacterized protein YfaS (alpha-2-macroglobulin family)
MALPVIRAGSEVFIRAKTYNMKADPPALFDPATSVKLTIYRPDGTKAVDALSMTKESTGVYIYSYQTSVGDATGAYRIEVKTTNGSSIVIQVPAEGYRLVA